MLGKISDVYRDFPIFPSYNRVVEYFPPAENLYHFAKILCSNALKPLKIMTNRLPLPCLMKIFIL